MNSYSMAPEFLEFLNSYQSALRRVCRIYGNSPQDREDLLQEMIYQLWRSYPTFRGESSKGTWVYRVALNTAISTLRTRKKTGKNVPLEPEHAQVSLPEKGNAQAEQLELLHAMIQRLSPVDRALVLLYLEDLSYKELANVLGLSESNVGVKLSRIKAKLQSFMKELE